jgi:hypothetical protein
VSQTPSPPIWSADLEPVGSGNRVGNLVRAWYTNLTASSQQLAERRRSSNALRQRAYKARNPVKVRARSEMHQAIQRGELVPKPCEDCGRADGVQGHHHDYAKPLDVTWLCRGCHKKRHIKHGRYVGQWQRRSSPSAPAAGKAGAA